MKTQYHIIFTLGCAWTYLAHPVSLPRLHTYFLDILNMSSKVFAFLSYIDLNDLHLFGKDCMWTPEGLFYESESG